MTWIILGAALILGGLRLTNATKKVVTIVLGILMLISGIGLREPAAAPNSTSSRDTPARTVTIEVSSDPSGASLIIDGLWRGETPVQVDVPAGENVRYRVQPDEPYDDYDLYKRFTGVLNASEDQAVSVWIERTTADEQAAQRAEAEEARQRAEEAEQQRRLANAHLIIENWGWSRSYSSYVVEGLVTNATPSTIGYGKATVRFFDNGGTFLSSDWTYLDYTTLLPGQSTTFKMYADYNPAYERASITFDADGVGLNTVERSELN